MGTRGLTAVMLDGKYPIAQYGQWDHYPDGQGFTALEFCRKWLTDPEKAGRFMSQLGGCRFVTDEEVDAAYKEAGSDGSGFVSMDVVRKFERRFPLINRDHGAKILGLVAGGEHALELQNSIEFASDSLFCEYAYVVDLDAMSLEVYKGFNRQPVPDGERFAKIELHKNHDGSPSGYFPVKLLAKFEIANLPSDEVFLEICEPNDSTEE